MRLIDADALDAAFTDLRFNADGTLAHWGDRKDWCMHGHEIERLIADAPTVEPEPVEPEKLTVLDYGSMESGLYLCGACKMPIGNGDKYCKHCGRKVGWSD